MNFEGNYRLQLDEKGRMRIPAKFREDLGYSGFVIMPGSNGNLIVMSKMQAAEFRKELGTPDTFDRQEQIDLEKITYFMNTPEVDEQGRFTLLQSHRKIAKINKEIVVAGAIDKLRIWSAEAFDEKFNVENIDFDAVFDKLKERSEERIKKEKEAEAKAEVKESDEVASE